MQIPQKLKDELIQLGDNSYCESLRIASTPGALGWEAKVIGGTFSGEEMAAHKAHNEAMGRHQGIYQALKLIYEFDDPPPHIFSVSEKLPENEQSVMTCGKVRWSNGETPKWFTNEFHGGEFSNYPEIVKYWFPLPEIPADVL